MNTSSDKFLSLPSPERHVSRIAAHASLMGCPAAHPAHARVLEVGCSTGEHLIAHALDFPSAHFVGVDFDTEAIHLAKSLTEKLGVQNITFIALDFLKLPVTEPFDYILIHGVLSWISQELRSELLLKAKEHLAPFGVLSVSYDCLPATYPREGIREMLSPLNVNVQDSRELLKFTSEHLDDGYNTYGGQLKSEIEQLSKQSDQFFTHALLAEEGKALYFHQVCDLAGRAKLKYLADGRLSRVRFHHWEGAQFPALSNTNLKNPKRIVKEHLLDFIYPIPFRSTLFCCDGVDLFDAPTLLSERELYISSPLLAEENFDPFASEQTETNDSTVPFRTPNGGVYETNSREEKALFRVLSQTWPVPIEKEELLLRAISQFSLPEQSRNQLRETLLRLLLQGLVDGDATAPTHSKLVTNAPRASTLARTQCLQSNTVTNLRHEYTVLNPFEALLLPLCDGSRTHEELFLEVEAKIDAVSLEVQQDGVPVTDSETRKGLIRESLQTALKGFGERALLVLEG